MPVEPEAMVSGPPPPSNLWQALEDSLRTLAGALGLGSPEQGPHSASITVITADRHWLLAKLASFLTSSSWDRLVITPILQRKKLRQGCGGILNDLPS